MRRFILIFLACIAFTFSAWSAPAAWEEVERPAAVERVDSDQPFEITTRDHYVYVTVTKPVNVKVFTILGQLISSKTLPVGVHRLRIESRGIYIMKIGSVTRRITI